jgi:protease YdgD
MGRHLNKMKGGGVGRAVLLLVCGLVGGGAEAAGTAGPVPPDHHVIVDADSYPWSAVGKLFNSIGGACTAAAIAPSKVLTAAHCLYAFRTRRFLPPDSIHFLLGYARGDYRIHARVSAIALGPGYDPADETRTAASDWAVLTLAEPLPATVRPIPLAAAVPPSGTAIEIGGFAQDRAYLMTADTHCRLLGPSSGSAVLAHDCVIAHGDSGAPLLVAAGDGSVQAFAVTVGFWSVAGRQVSIAAPVTAAIVETARSEPAEARR